MSTVSEHYESHLGPIYVWMAGGAEAAFAAGEAEIDDLELPRAKDDLVVDLGAGFGAHAIPLARSGARVVAVDTSVELLRTLDLLRGSSPVTTVAADLLTFPEHLAGDAASAILCMGDTLTHLPSLAAVDALFQRAFAALVPGGVFVASFRDYTTALEGEARFILVRSDASRILTCFLEYEPDAVVVHDVVHERVEGEEGFAMRTSAYRKLRLAPDAVVAIAEARGFVAQREPGMRGMVRVVARKV